MKKKLLVFCVYSWCIFLFPNSVRQGKEKTHAQNFLTSPKHKESHSLIPKLFNRSIFPLKMSLLNLKLRQENAVNINMCSIITKYPFNVLRSNCLVMVVLTICILITSLIQNVAIVPQVQTSHPRKPCSSLRGNNYLSFPIAWQPRTVSLKATESMAVRLERGHTAGFTPLGHLTWRIMLAWFLGKIRKSQRSSKCKNVTF